MRTTLDVATVLIIDDSPEDRDIYRQFLQRDVHQTYHILEAETGEEGCLQVQDTACDLILLDFQLPDMDGLEVLSTLHRMLMSSVPVIMLTGRGDEATAVKAMKQGVYDYLIKQ